MMDDLANYVDKLKDICYIKDTSISDTCDRTPYKWEQSSGKANVFLRSTEAKEVNVCFYDSHRFEGNAYHLPTSYSNNTFKCWGRFCSLECVRSFISDSAHPKKDSQNSCLSLMAVKMYGIKALVEKAPCKFQLQLYGGPLSIEEFRNANKSMTYMVTRVPNLSYSCVVYDTYLNNTIFEPDPSHRNKRKLEDKKIKQASLELKRHKTPAYQAKLSLMNMLGKSQAQ
tara:strand:- start:4766 stop:5446 length:681 start_codon:yes stop_codon:yes gene_type:complete